MKTIKMHLLLLSCLMVAGIAGAQEISPMVDSVAVESNLENTTEEMGFDFFDSEEPLEMTLSFDFSEFLKTREKPECLPATLTLIQDSDSVTQQIKIKARGELRRTICSFPPIMLKFNSGKQEARPIRKKGSLKLVTPCKNLTTFEIYVLKEYLAYKMFNLVTPYSFKTRLVKISYIDKDNPKKAHTAYGFIIENEKDMAARNHAEMVETRGIQNNHISRTDFIRMAVFNYMIGNTDWWITSQHNVKMLKPANQLPPKVIPVAFDFDYSGFVNTDYAVPDKSLPISQVTERYYMGICCSEEEIDPVLEEFTELQERFIATIDNFNLLPKGYKKQSVNYIKSFYNSGRKGQILISDLNETCQMFK